MKIIVTGATGRIGGAALQSALSHPTVTSVIVLSRRDIGVQHAKLQTIIKKDYLQYSPEELAQLEGAEACVWYVLFKSLSAKITSTF
jgi:dihydrodipicolinate reductase